MIDGLTLYRVTVTRTEIELVRAVNPKQAMREAARRYNVNDDSFGIRDWPDSWIATSVSEENDGSEAEDSYLFFGDYAQRMRDGAKKETNTI